MSRIGKKSISIPSGVKVELDDRTVKASGPKGNLSLDLTDPIDLNLEENTISITRKSDEPKVKALHGLTRALVNNMVTGVHTGFHKKLVISGVGFKAELKGKQVVMALGYSHQCIYDLPEQITVKVEEGGTTVSIEGPDKQKVGQVASEMRAFYPPEPYKGKGVRYSDEQIRRKEGKKVQ